MRMFVALIPPENVIDDLDTFLRAGQGGAASSTSLRWTARAQWHITLTFMPAVAQRQLDDLMKRLDRAAGRRGSFVLSLAGSVAFPRADRARVLGVGVDASDAEELRRLAVGTHAAAARSGAEVARGRFHPHLTLARLRQPAEVGGWVRTLEGYRGPGWQVETVSLVESHLGEGARGRPRYEIIESFDLG
ncbi:MAG: RNA 2',3'-cyclic phosphodiesterase [Mycobacteriaceae bacterium]